MDYRAELERRIGQFHRHLAPMDRRAHEEAHGPCYTVLENRHPDGDFGGQTTEERQPAREERQPALAAVTEMFGGGESTVVSKPDEPGLSDLPEGGWREEGERVRFVQFSFERDFLYMDLPRQTLSFDEALEVLWHREGFFYLRDRPQFALPGELGEIEGFDPSRRVYLYGDEGQAAVLSPRPAALPVLVPTPLLFAH